VNKILFILLILSQSASAETPSWKSSVCKAVLWFSAGAAASAVPEYFFSEPDPYVALSVDSRESKGLYRFQDTWIRLSDTGALYRQDSGNWVLEAEGVSQLSVTTGAILTLNKEGKLSLLVVNEGQAWSELEPIAPEMSFRSLHAKGNKILAVGEEYLLYSPPGEINVYSEALATERLRKLFQLP